MTTTNISDWTSEIISYGESREWRPLRQRGALKEFCEATGIARRTGMAADRAFRLAYNSLAAATPEERAACRDWQDVLDVQERQREARRQAARELVALDGEVWIGHAMFREFAPVPAITLRGVPTVLAVPIRAHSQEEAAEKLRRWYDLGDRLAPLYEATGHIWCFSPDDPRHADCCDQHADLAALKDKLEAERAALLA